jgi:hypothetical protein
MRTRLSHSMITVLALASSLAALAGEGTGGSGNCPRKHGKANCPTATTESRRLDVNAVALPLARESSQMILNEIDLLTLYTRFSEPTRQVLLNALDSVLTPFPAAPDRDSPVLMRSVARDLQLSLQANPPVLSLNQAASLYRALIDSPGLVNLPLPVSELPEGRVLVVLERGAARAFLAQPSSHPSAGSFLPFRGERIGSREVALVLEQGTARRLHDGNATGGDLAELEASVRAGLQGTTPPGYMRCGPCGHFAQPGFCGFVALSDASCNREP